MLKVGQAKELKILLLDNDGAPTAGTVSYVVYDETDTSFVTGNMTSVAGVTGFYVMSFTPDAAGEWTVKLACASPVRNAMQHFQVGEGVETDIFDILKVGGTGDLAAILADTNELQTDWKDGGRLDNILDSILTESQSHPTLAEIEAGDLATLLTESQSHPTLAEIEATAVLALEATSQLIKTETDKIAGLLTESQSHPTLAEIEATAVLALEATLGTHDTDIKADIGDFSAQSNLTSLLAALGIPDVSGKSLYTCLITDRLDSATFGLSAIEALVDDLESRLTATRAGYLDELDFDLDARLGTPSTSILADLEARFNGRPLPLDFWSDGDNLIQITGGSTDVNLPNVIVPTLPTGVTIWKVVLLFKCALIRDTSTSDNAINGAAVIRIKKSTGSWGVDDIAAYDIQDDSWAVDVSTSPDRAGDAFVGNMNNDNLSGEVDGAATYNLRFEDIQADGANLELHDVAVGLRVYIY